MSVSVLGRGPSPTEDDGVRNGTHEALTTGTRPAHGLRTADAAPEVNVRTA